MMERHGWNLLFHDCIVEQLKKLHDGAERARRNAPQDWETNANVKLYRALSRLILEVIPLDPGRDDYRQGNTLGPEHRHWRRAKVGRRFRLFFRYDTRSRTIVYAWVNDEQSMRASGSRSDPYSTFSRMLKRGNPPNDWHSLLATSQQWDPHKP